MKPLWYRHRETALALGRSERPWSAWKRFDENHPSGRVNMIQYMQYEFTDEEPFIPGRFVHKDYVINGRVLINLGMPVTYFTEDPGPNYVRVKLELA